MKKWIDMALYFVVFGGMPVLFAFTQDVPMKSGWQQIALAASLGGFGLLLGLFWLSRLLPRGVSGMKRVSTMRWHKSIGYVFGLIMLAHPVLLIARRFQVKESNPLDNLRLLIESPMMRSGIVAWCLLLAIIITALFRKRVPARGFRIVHGLLSVGFVFFAGKHVVQVGRHSDLLMSVFWIVLAVAAFGRLLSAYLKVLFKRNTGGEVHESA